MFSIPTRVYWEDTDAGGVVYHAQYLAFLERARTEWLRARGYGQDILRGGQPMEGWTWCSRCARCGSISASPARLDDALDVSVALRECRRASLVVVQTIDRDGTRLLDAEVRVAALGASDFRPRAIPAPLYEVLKSLEATQVP